MTSLRLISATLFAVLSASGCATVEDGPQSMPDLAQPPKLGLVRIGSSSVTSGLDTFEQSMAMALFFDPNAASPVCTRSHVGSCTLYRCGALSSVPSSGDIRIKGGSEDVVLSPSQLGVYSEYRSTSALVFQRGQTISLRAAGKDVPSWQTTLSIPSPVFALRTPSPARIDLMWVLSKRQDLSLSWTPLSVGSTVRIELTQDMGASQGSLVECVFDGNKGSGIVPSGVLSQLQVTQGQSHAIGVLVGPGIESQLSPMGYELSVFGIGVGRAGIATLTE